MVGAEGRLEDRDRLIEQRSRLLVAVAVEVEGRQHAARPGHVNVVLAEVGSEKIKVIKVVREITGLGLKEAKAVVDEAPKAVKESIAKEEAEEIVKKFEEVGAKMEIKAA